MRANEQEIPFVSDTAPKAVQKLQKAKKSPSVQKILGPIEPPSSTYRPIQVEDRLSQPKLPPGLVTPLDFFSLFITPFMLEQISEFTNTKAQKTERTAKQRLWVPTSGAEIGVFVGILLSMGLISINRTKSYWIQLTTSAYCTPCKAVKRFTSGAGKGVKRKALSEVTGNGQPKQPRQRTVQTKYGCTSEQCAG